MSYPALPALALLVLVMGMLMSSMAFAQTTTVRETTTTRRGRIRARAGEAPVEGHFRHGQRLPRSTDQGQRNCLAAPSPCLKKSANIQHLTGCLLEAAALSSARRTANWILQVDTWC